jgi:hypothetical protein
MVLMKKEINPVVAIACVVAVLAVAALIWWRGASSPEAASATPTGMPPSAAAEFQKRMGTTAPTSQNAGQSQGSRPPGAPGAAGAPAGYLAPPPPGGR